MMSLRTVLTVTFFIAVFRNILKSDSGFDFGDAVILVSGVGLLILLDNMKWQRRVAALEYYLTKCAPQCLGKHDSALLSAPSTELEACSRMLKTHLNAVIGERHPKTSRQHHDQVRDHIARQLRDFGWDVRLEAVKGPHGTGHNVIAERRPAATNQSNEIIIVGAHYDTVTGTPGADDNGIAVAGVLSLAKILQNIDLKHTVRLVAWDLEEQQGWGRCLLGSRTMVRNIKRSGESVIGVICLEMIGLCDHTPGSQQIIPGLRWVAPDVARKSSDRQDRADFIAAVTNLPGQELVKHFTDAAQSRDLPSITLVNKGLVRMIKDLRRSDHAPFWDAGIPAIMLTDTSNFRSPFYHTAMDRIETIDFEFAGNVVLSAADCIRKIAAVVPRSLPAEQQRISTIDSQFPEPLIA